MLHSWWPETRQERVHTVKRRSLSWVWPSRHRTKLQGRHAHPSSTATKGHRPTQAASLSHLPEVLLQTRSHIPPSQEVPSCSWAGTVPSNLRWRRDEHTQASRVAADHSAQRRLPSPAPPSDPLTHLDQADRHMPSAGGTGRPGPSPRSSRALPVLFMCLLASGQQRICQKCLTSTQSELRRTRTGLSQGPSPPEQRKATVVRPGPGRAVPDGRRSSGWVLPLARGHTGWAGPVSEMPPLCSLSNHP